MLTFMPPSRRGTRAMDCDAAVPRADSAFLGGAAPPAGEQADHRPAFACMRDPAGCANAERQPALAPLLAQAGPAQQTRRAPTPGQP